MKNENKTHVLMYISLKVSSQQKVGKVFCILCTLYSVHYTCVVHYLCSIYVIVLRCYYSNFTLKPKVSLRAFLYMYKHTCTHVVCCMISSFISCRLVLYLYKCNTDKHAIKAHKVSKYFVFCTRKIVIKMHHL